MWPVRILRRAIRCARACGVPPMPDRRAVISLIRRRGSCACTTVNFAHEHRPSQRPPSGVRPTHAGHRGGPLRYQSPRRLPAHSGHPAASSAHPHPELHLLTPQGGTFRPWSSSTTVNAMTESGVPSSRQDTTPGRPLASTARSPRGCASGQSPASCPKGCLDHLSLLRSANRRPLGRPDPSRARPTTILVASVDWPRIRPISSNGTARRSYSTNAQSLPRPERLEDDEAREPGAGGVTRRRHLAPRLLPLDPDRDLPPSATLRRSSRPCRGFRR